MKLYILKINTQWADTTLGVIADNYERMCAVVMMEKHVQVGPADLLFSCQADPLLTQEGIVFEYYLEREDYEG